MKKIVFADTDKEYMSLLEEYLAEEWAEKADIEMITEPDYLEKFFLETGDLFLLVIHKSLYLQEEKIGTKRPRYILLLLEEAGEKRSLQTRGKNGQGAENRESRKVVSRYDTGRGNKEASRYDTGRESREAGRYDTGRESREAGRYDTSREIQETSRYDTGREIQEAGSGQPGEERGIRESGSYSAYGSNWTNGNGMFCGQTDALVQEIYKYSDMQELFARIRVLFSEEEPSDTDRRTKLILAHACSGGVGKTTGTLGMCIAFAKMHRRVLYVSTESVQDFGLYLNDAQRMDPEEAFGISINDARLALNPPVSQDGQGYDYIRILPKITQVYQIQSRSFVFLIRKLLEGNQYDVIVAELPLDADADLLSLYDVADRIVMFCRQDIHSMKKLRIFLQSLMVPCEKYILLCNWYDDRKQDALKGRMLQTGSMQTFYIQACETALTPEKISMEKSIEAISYAIL